MDDQSRAKIRQTLREKYPHRDFSGLFAGRLAGPEDADRPNFPPWMYLNDVDPNDAVEVMQVARVRFPLVTEHGEEVVTSLCELALLPPHVECEPGDIYDVVSTYARLADRHVIEWSSESRAVVQQPGYAEKAGARRTFGDRRNNQPPRIGLMAGASERTPSADPGGERTFESQIRPTQNQDERDANHPVDETGSW